MWTKTRHDEKLPWIKWTQSNNSEIYTEAQNNYEKCILFICEPSSILPFECTFLGASNAVNLVLSIQQCWIPKMRLQPKQSNESSR